MTCYYPKKAFIKGLKSNGKKDLKITEYEVSYLIKDNKNNKLIKVFDKSFCSNALNCGEKLCNYKCDRFSPRFQDDVDYSYVYEFIPIPCGQCLGCRIEYSRQWACRMMLELPYSSGSCFITLTYDDDHITKFKKKVLAPWSRKGFLYQYPNQVEFCNTSTGELSDRLTLNKEDWQNFMKRLRKEFGEGVRFYMCGEYGEEHLRPHYHAILFNCDFPDKRFFKRSPDGKFNYYVSDTLARLWPFGYHLITDVSFDTCAYVARYVTKKAKGLLADVYRDNGLLPEFSMMSRRPGLGRLWFDEHGQDAYNTYIINVSTSKGGLKLRPPRYYDNLFDALDGVRMAEIKENKRLAAESISRLKLDNTDLDYLGMLQVEEYNFSHNPKNRFGLLKREEF